MDKVEIYKNIKIRKGKNILEPYKNENNSYYDNAGNNIKYFRLNEIRAIIDNASSGFYKMLYLFLFETAARISEARLVKFKDIDFDMNKVKIITMKQRKNKGIIRVLFISDTLKSLILMHRLNNKLIEDDFIFSKKNKGQSVTQQAVSKMMIKDILTVFGENYKQYAHPHVFRHSRAINLLDTGMNVVKLQIILGHSSIQNTLIYLKYSNSEILKGMEEANIKNGVK